MWASECMRVKSTGVIGWCNDLDCLTARIDDLRTNEILQRIKNIILERQIIFFSARMSVSLWKKIVHSLAIPPLDEKTKGINDALSTSWASSLPIATLLVTFMLLVYRLH